ncbi:hypothetical protein [Nocardia donostiensis]|uniref:Uncharacterized protein n=1 Tax=Nocardia donostiensis TaxID=1538463 RepID=A0A1V2T9U9_9NOCA|nr:hypothetical protein [Nocardia donostiensis]ONM46228.1 hypothetical protein B0T46_23880 [Nocardia donostiensis]OQS13347.1 hypothetical protein B0T36_19715 [Nocardia donostiensis]OQS18447.1 hypothetical protein B0T44_19810 [Nocardia donostiensis]
MSSTLSPGPGSDGLAEDEKRLLAYLLGIGGGQISIETTPFEGSRANRSLSLIAGTAARVALDVGTGGIVSLPSPASAAAAPTHAIVTTVRSDTNLQ